jgi:hypothetical protein
MQLHVEYCLIPCPIFVAVKDTTTYTCLTKMVCRVGSPRLAPLTTQTEISMIRHRSFHVAVHLIKLASWQFVLCPCHHLKSFLPLIFREGFLGYSVHLRNQDTIYQCICRPNARKKPKANNDEDED